MQAAAAHGTLSIGGLNATAMTNALRLVSSGPSIAVIDVNAFSGTGGTSIVITLQASAGLDLSTQKCQIGGHVVNAEVADAAARQVRCEVPAITGGTQRTLTMVGGSNAELLYAVPATGRISSVSPTQQQAGTVSTSVNVGMNAALSHLVLSQQIGGQQNPLVFRSGMKCCFGDTTNRCSQGALSSVSGVSSGNNPFVTCTAVQHPPGVVNVSLSLDGGQTWLPPEANAFTYTCDSSEYLEQTSCHVCPEGATCDGTPKVYAQDGYYQGQAHVGEPTVYRCQYADACDGTSANHTHSGCASGYHGPLCGLCDDGLHMGSLGECSACPGGGGFSTLWIGVLVVAVLIILCVALCFWQLSKHNEELVRAGSDAVMKQVATAISDPVHGEDECLDDANEHGKSQLQSILGFFKILVSYGQIMSIVPPGLRVVWPEEFANFLQIFVFFSIDITGLFGADCMFGERSFYLTFFFSLCLPVFPTLINYAVFILREALKNPDRDPKLTETHRAQHIRLQLYGIFLIWPGVSGDMMYLFRCTEIHGKSYLNKDLSIVCWEGNHAIIAAVCGSSGLLLYTFGIPILFYLVIRKSAKEEVLGKDETKESLGFLYKQYKYSKEDGGLWYFEVILMLYKALLIAAIVFLQEDSAIQGLVTFAVSNVFVMICMQLKAFKDTYEGITQEVTAGAIAATMFMGILLQHSDAMRHAKPHENDLYSKGALGGLLVATNVVVVTLVVIGMTLPLLSKCKGLFMPSAAELPSAQTKAGNKADEDGLEMQEVNTKDPTVATAGVQPNGDIADDANRGRCCA